MIVVVQSMTWRRYDDVKADHILVRSSILKSLDDLKSVRSVISKPTDERSRDDNRQVICLSEIARS